MTQEPKKLRTYHLAVDQFKPDTIGTYVKDYVALKGIILEELETFKFPANGIGVIPLPEEAIELVTAGNAKRHLLNTETAIIREHRGLKQVYLNRDRIDLGNPSYVMALVYTKDAFIKDRMAEERENQKTLQLSEKEIQARMVEYALSLGKAWADWDYVWVTTIASEGPPNPPVTPYRFVHNLASRNPKYTDIPERVVDRAKSYIETIEKTDGDFQVEIQDTVAWKFCELEAKTPHPRSSVAEAQNIIEYWSEWVVVAASPWA